MEIRPATLPLPRISLGIHTLPIEMHMDRVSEAALVQRIISEQPHPRIAALLMGPLFGLFKNEKQIL